MSSSSRSLNRVLLAGVAALVMAGGSIGYVLAQQGPPPGNSAQPERSGRPGNDTFLRTLASKLGISVDRLKQAITETRSEIGPKDRGPHPSERSGPGRDRPGASLRGPIGLAFDAAAEAIGISTDQLRQELPGKTLTQVAQAYGKNPVDVAAALKTAANQRLDQAVASGRLTAERAAAMKQRVAEQIDSLMNRTVPEGLGKLRRAPGRGAPRT